MASRGVTLETLDHSDAGNTCPSNQRTQTNEPLPCPNKNTSRSHKDLDRVASRPIQPACQKIRQYLINQFGYEVKDANEFINDLVRTHTDHPQDNS